MTTDAVVHNLTLVSIQPTKMLLMWTPYGGDDDDNGDDDDDENKLHDPRCLAIKVCGLEVTPEMFVSIISNYKRFSRFCTGGQRQVAVG